MNIRNKSHTLVSIIIINFNNKKFLDRSVKSVLNQSYPSKEIIIVDDNSNDGSIEFLKKYKKRCKIIINKKKTLFGSYNQINCISKAIKIAKGKLIFFLDSDDFFSSNKILFIKKKFDNHTNCKVLFDKSILYFNKYKQKKIDSKFKKIRLAPWPKFYPQSCISIEKKYLMKIFKNLKVKRFPNIWFDFRIALQTYIDFNNINIIDNYLTYYQQSKNQVSSKFKKFSLNWWKRRNEAHDFTNYLFRKNKLKNKKKLDEYITKIINIIFF